MTRNNARSWCEDIAVKLNRCEGWDTQVTMLKEIATALETSFADDPSPLDRANVERVLRAISVEDIATLLLIAPELRDDPNKGMSWIIMLMSRAAGNTMEECGLLSDIAPARGEGEP